MMKRSVIAMGIGVVALLGFGVWLGRSSSSSVGTANATPEETLAEPAAPTRAHVPTIAPSLSARSTNLPAELVADLAASDPKIRRAAVREVSESSDPDPNVMLAASRDPDLAVAGIAMHALGKLYADGRVPLKEMVARATDHGLNERVRSSALNGLGLVENADAAAVLVELLARGDVLERRSAAALLAHQDTGLAVPALIRALNDADEYVRGNAVDSLKVRSRGRDFGTDAGAWQAWWQSRSR